MGNPFSLPFQIFYSGFTVFLACLILLAAGCMESGNAENDDLHEDSAGREPVRLVYVDWASEKASTHVVRAVIEQRLNRRCEMTSVSLIAMWESLAAGDQDASVSAWLPNLQQDYLQKHRNDIDNLGPNLEGTRIGLVVPDYVPIDTIPELNTRAAEFGNKIIGIDPYAGIMGKAARAIDAYGLSGFALVSGSGPTMSTALEKAVSEKRWIVVTGWAPHWKFARWDLKYLGDPKGIFGNKEHIATIARKGLQKDMPEVYAFLDSFYWRPADLAEVMQMAQNQGTSHAEAAEKWLANHRRRVDRWIGPSPDPARDAKN